jgi:hypothetical protein
VSPIFAQMRGNAVRSGQNGHVRGPDRVGMDAAPRIPHGRDVIDIDAKA